MVATQNGQKTKGTELDKKKEKDIHAKSIITPTLINSTHFHTLPHFCNFTNFKNPTFSFWSWETLNKKPILQRKKNHNYSPRPSPQPPPLTSPPPSTEGDRRTTWRRIFPPCPEEGAEAKRSDQSDDREVEMRQRRGGRGAHSVKKLRREGGGGGNGPRSTSRLGFDFEVEKYKRRAFTNMYTIRIYS